MPAARAPGLNRPRRRRRGPGEQDDAERRGQQEHEGAERVAHAELRKPAIGGQRLQHDLLEGDRRGDDQQAEDRLGHAELADHAARAEDEQLRSGDQPGDRKDQAERQALGTGLAGRGLRRAATAQDERHQRGEREQQQHAVRAREAPVEAQEDGQRRGHSRRRQQWSRRAHGERCDDPGDPEARRRQEDRRADRGPERGSGEVVERRRDAGGGRLDVEAEHERAQDDPGQAGRGRPALDELDEALHRLDQQPHATAEGQ